MRNYLLKKFRGLSVRYLDLGKQLVGKSRLSKLARRHSNKIRRVQILKLFILIKITEYFVVVGSTGCAAYWLGIFVEIFLSFFLLRALIFSARPFLVFEKNH